MTDAKTVGQIAFEAFNREQDTITPEDREQEKMWSRRLTDRTRAAWESAAMAVIDAADYDKTELVSALKRVYYCFVGRECDCGEKSDYWIDHANYCPEYLRGYILSKLP